MYIGQKAAVDQKEGCVQRPVGVISVCLILGVILFLSIL